MELRVVSSPLPLLSHTYLLSVKTFRAEVALIAEDQAGEPGLEEGMAASTDHRSLVEEALLTREDDPNALRALTHTHAFHILRLA